jgi:tRNA-Thr(GGU) m(6)t(6)A37 methyltransferase TsaA
MDRDEAAIHLVPIGYVENAFLERADPDVIKAQPSRIRLKAEYTPGLKGLEVGDRIMVVFYFHKSQGYQLLQHRRGDPSRPLRGVFDLHSPDRPNPIGVRVVDLVHIEGEILEVAGLDALNGTPVLDIKSAD